MQFRVDFLWIPPTHTHTHTPLNFIAQAILESLGIHFWIPTKYMIEQLLLEAMNYSDISLYKTLPWD